MTTSTAPHPASCETEKARRATFVVFSGELDRALAALTLATTSAAAGLHTTVFFTFWGLTVLRRPGQSKGGSFIDRMFGAMLPKGARKLPMSRMHFLGIGPRLIRWRMGKAGQPDLETLLERARDLGVRIVACEASTQVLGMGPDALRPEVEIAGAMTCIHEASASDVSLFI